MTEQMEITAASLLKQFEHCRFMLYTPLDLDGKEMKGDIRHLAVMPFSVFENLVKFLEEHST